MNVQTPSRPSNQECPPFALGYVSLVPENDILAVLEGQLMDTLALYNGVTETTANKRHPPYTWSVKQVAGHMNDCERIFGVRALRFARGDGTPLPGFDENEYMRFVDFDAREFRDLVHEFEMIRRSHLAFFQHLDSEAWLRTGTANNSKASVRALAYIIAGHMRHHVAILRKRLAT